MAVSQDGRIKVEGGTVFERAASDSWTKIGTAEWAVGGDYSFIADDPSRIHPLELPIGQSELSLANSISKFILLTS